MKQTIMILMTGLLLTSCGAIQEKCGSDIKMLCNNFFGEKPVEDLGLEKKVDNRIDDKLAEFEQQVDQTINQINQDILMLQNVVVGLNAQFTGDIALAMSLIDTLTNRVDTNTADILALEASILDLEGEVVSMEEVCGETLIKQGEGSEAVYVAAMNVFNTITIPTAELTGSVTVSECNISNVFGLCVGITQHEINEFESDTIELKYLESVYLDQLDEDVRFQTTTDSASCQFEIQNGEIVQF